MFLDRLLGNIWGGKRQKKGAKKMKNKRKDLRECKTGCKK
jgi:hypothetical protein